MNKLKIVRMLFETEVRKDIILPGFLGNTLRGALGSALFAEYCVRKDRLSSVDDEPDCAHCESRADCIYSAIFKTSAIPDFPGSPPNPFTIKTDFHREMQKYGAGERFTFEILLFGRAVTRASDIAGCAKTAMENVFAGTVGHLKLRRILDCGDENACSVIFENGSWVGTARPTLWTDEYEPNAVSKIELYLLTPMRLLQKAEKGSGKELLREPDFAMFIDSLFARIAAITDIYGDSPFVLPYGLCYRKPFVTAEAETEEITVEQERRSKKHVTRGIIGKLQFTGNISAYMPYIELGRRLHIGKLTTRGFGAYSYRITE
jgi:hypothetical protein